MKRLVFAILPVLLAGPAAVGFQQSSEVAGPVATATIVNSKYCLGTPSANLPVVRRNGRLEPIELYPPDAITLRLQVSVMYRNASSSPWILPVATQEVVLAGADRSALIEVPQPYLTQGSAASDKLPDANEDAPSQSLFPTLAPGQSVSAPTLIESVFFRVYTPSIRSEPDFRGKKIYLQLELFSSRWTPRLLTRLAKKWKTYGTLWTESVRTEPLQIDVPRMPEISDCLH